LESPSITASVLGYDVAINKVLGKLVGVWLGASGTTLPNPNQIRVHTIDGDESTFTTTKFGTPSAPLSINGNTLVLGCEKRLCALDTVSKKLTLISAWQSDDPIQNGWITLNGKKSLVAGINGQLTLLSA
jgi:hypothetical protein